ncbi:unnamed protein product [Closterium sp. NIES-65]|nr:unnamed protein product [Closterium sp. NIES-65]
MGDASDTDMAEQHEVADADTRYTEQQEDTDGDFCHTEQHENTNSDYRYTEQHENSNAGYTRTHQRRVYYDAGPAGGDQEQRQLEGPEDVSARQVRRGRDIQGIPWERLHLSREKYRAMRLQQYKNYKNLDVSLDVVDKVRAVFMCAHMRHHESKCQASSILRYIHLLLVLHFFSSFGFPPPSPSPAPFPSHPFFCLPYPASCLTLHPPRYGQVTLGLLNLPLFFLRPLFFLLTPSPLPLWLLLSCLTPRLACQFSQEVQQVTTGSNFYEFTHNTRAVKSTIVHFQLRNLVWATSAHDVYSLHHHVINHFSPLTRKSTPVLDLGNPLVARRHAPPHAHAPTAGARGAGGAGGAVGRGDQRSGVQLEPSARAIYTGAMPSAAGSAAAGRSNSSSSGTEEGRAVLGREAGGLALSQQQQQQQQEGVWEAVDRVQVSTMCVRHGLLVAGGFHGEMVCTRLGTGSEADAGSGSEAGVAFTGRVSRDQSAITNAVEIFRSNSGALSVLTSNNDCVVRDFDIATFSILSRQAFPWPVNHTAVAPDSTLVSVVGDDPEALLLDLTSGKVVARMQGHVDYSFATAWHPGGNLFATGNQDTTCRVWDRRRLDNSLFTLKGRLGAIRSLRFTSDGRWVSVGGRGKGIGSFRFMAMAEPADFVHVFDTSSGFTRAQEIDIFGEIAGISFSPDTEALFIGVADRTYSSLLEYTRAHSYAYLDACI